MRKSRREFLRLAAGGAAALAAPGLALADLAEPRPVAPVPLVNLRGPDFAKLGKSVKYIARVRPHRNGGVRLGEDAPLEGPGGTKYLIHNYGHSGAGITLSWGCAAEVCRYTSDILDRTGLAATPPPVAILGTGIIGLTVATELRRRWPGIQITNYAKDTNAKNTTSYFAGGQFAPSQIFREYKTKKDRAILLGYLTKSRDRLEEIVAMDPGGQVFGIKKNIMNYALFPEEALQKLIDWGVLPGPPVQISLSFGPKADARQRSGTLYRTWLVDPTILLPKLVLDLTRGGVKFVKQTFKSRDDFLKLKETILINCTGYGAAALMNDEAMEPHRGHLVVLKNMAPKLDYFFSGGCGQPNSLGGAPEIAYMFARQNDIVIGGTVADTDPGDRQNFPKWFKTLERDFFDKTDPDDRETCRVLLDNAKRIFSGEPETCQPPPRADLHKAG